MFIVYLMIVSFVQKLYIKLIFSVAQVRRGA